MGFRLATAASLVTLIVVLPTPARAGDPLPGRMPGQTLPPRMQRPRAGIAVGNWVEYSVRDRIKRQRMKLHWALVKRRGQRYWWELTMRKSGQKPLRIRTRIKGRLARPTGVEQVVVQIGNNRPLELPQKKGQRLMKLYTRRKPGTRAKILGTVTLRTPGGTFTTQHLRWTDANGDVCNEYHSDSAGIWGVVRFRSSRVSIELIGLGRGARSKIRGVPAKWHLPGR